VKGQYNFYLGWLNEGFLWRGDDIQTFETLLKHQSGAARSLHIESAVQDKHYAQVIVNKNLPCVF
jgi:hypothetical protein